MLTLVPLSTSHTLHPAAPACQPCPWPVSRLTPEPTPRVSYSIADCTRAYTRCQELAQAHPSWPQSRVRATVARELCVATFTLRYLLRRAATPDAPTLAQAA